MDEHAIQLVATPTERGFAFWGALGIIYRGWVMINNGDQAAGMSLLRRGSSAYPSTGAEAWMPYHTALLASAYQVAGQDAEDWSFWRMLYGSLKGQESDGS